MPNDGRSGLKTSGDKSSSEPRPQHYGSSGVQAVLKSKVAAKVCKSSRLLHNTVLYLCLLKCTFKVFGFLS